MPPLYARWIDEFLGGPVPDETRSTCSDCAMCDNRQDGQQASFFDPRAKCCTYYPELPNFLVGRIFADDHPGLAEGQRLVAERIACRVAVTPWGLGTSSKEKTLYKEFDGNGRFGTSTEVRCPYYIEDGGRCSIWRHRNSVCSTWFCKFERGITSAEFWKSMRQVLGTLEQSLAAWCALQLDVENAAIERLMSDDRDQKSDVDHLPDDAYKEIWGEWCGNEEEYYRRCAELVEELSWGEVLDICGVAGQVAGRLARQTYDKLGDTSVPAALRVAPYRVVSSDFESQRLEAYSPHDPIDVSRLLVDVLHHFDGRPTEEALRDIERENALRVDAALIRRLVDFKILIPMSAFEV